MRPAVFLDRDGVLNRAIVRDGVPHPPHSIEEIEILPEATESLAKLSEAGLPLIVVTNQPDVARGTQTREGVEQINNWLRQRLPLTDILTCYHDGPDNCACRKPKPGLIIQASEAYNIDLSGSFMIGDRWSDIAAGQAAGCRTMLIEMAYSNAEKCSPDYRVRDLSEAAEIILRSLSGQNA